VLAIHGRERELRDVLEAVFEKYTIPFPQDDRDWRSLRKCVDESVTLGFTAAGLRRRRRGHARPGRN